MDSNMCCKNCRHFHELWHNFSHPKGFEESFCCDVLLHLEPETEGWVQEVDPNSICELWNEEVIQKTSQNIIPLSELTRLQNAYDDVYSQIYAHHYELLHEPDSQTRAAKLSLSNWILDLLTGVKDEAFAEHRESSANNNREV